MALRHTIKVNFESLQRSLDPSILFLGKLGSVPFVEDRLTLVKQRTTIEEQIDELLAALRDVPSEDQESVLNDLIEALRSSGQEHVANIFRRESDKVPMSDKHYDLLSNNRCQLCQFIEPRNRLVDYLISSGVFSETDRSRVLSKPGVDEMAEETINIFLRKSDCCFDKFLNALNITGQDHVAYLLTGVGRLPMSDEHRELLRRNMYQLCQFLDVDNGLLDILISQHIIIVVDAERIRSAADDNKMARELVMLLMRKQDDAFNAFIAALSQSGQSHVAYILTGEGDSRPLKEEYRSRLVTGNRYELVRTIDSKSSGLISYLMSKGVFSRYDEERVIKAQPDTYYNRNEIILNLLAKKSQADFFKFISALNDTEQTHVVVTLIGAEVVAKIKAAYDRGNQSGDLPGLEAELLKYMYEMFELNKAVISKLNEILSVNGTTVIDVREGCVQVTFACKDRESLNSFRGLYRSGELEKLFNDAICPVFEEKGLEFLEVKIPDEQFERGEQMFSRMDSMTSERCPTVESSAKWLLNKLIVSGDLQLKLMTPEHHEALKSSSDKWLLEKMKVNDELLDKLTLCKRRREAIESAGTHELQVKTLLDIVSCQPDSAFTQLCNALKDTQQTEVASFLCRFQNAREKQTKKELGGNGEPSANVVLELEDPVEEITQDNVVSATHTQSTLTPTMNLSDYRQQLQPL